MRNNEQLDLLRGILRSGVGGVIAACIAMCAGCAPGLGSTLGVGSIEVQNRASNVPISPSIEVSVRPLSDARKRDAIGEISGRVLSASGDISPAVQRAIEERLRLAGVKLRLFNTPSIGGEIRDWYVKVEPGFPSSTASASARLDLVVYDRLGQIVYRAAYTGEANAEHPFLTESKIQKVLGDAMAYAIEGMIDDDRLIEAIRSHS